MGKSDGKPVGMIVGTLVGCNEGKPVGYEGIKVGTMEGREVGSLVGA